ncbi:MAG: hypothetical protein QF415_03095 [Candidatus Undinarchaeales archaeon]|nr:hypothetical protein [Candidatus Undinarchaeales archaeon]MDP7491790.1 hypothetical protein [Candidatus Undinarchaeales archaeon]
MADKKPKGVTPGLANIPFPVFRYLPDLEGHLKRSVRSLEKSGLKVSTLWGISYAGSTINDYTVTFEPLTSPPKGIPANALLVGFPSEGEASELPVAVYVAQGANDDETADIIESMGTKRRFELTLPRIVHHGEGDGVQHQILVAATPELLSPRNAWEEVVMSALEDDDLVIRNLEEGLVIAAFPAEADKKANNEALEQIASLMREKIRGKPFLYNLLDPLINPRDDIKIDDLGKWGISIDARKAVLGGEVIAVGMIDVEAYINNYLWVFEKVGVPLGNVNISELANEMGAIIPVHGKQLRAFFNRAIMSIAYEGHSLKEEAMIKGRCDVESAIGS